MCSNISQMLLLYKTWRYYNKFDSTKPLGVYYRCVKIPQCGYIEHGLKDIAFYVTACTVVITSLLVRDKPLEASASVKRCCVHNASTVPWTSAGQFGRPRGVRGRPWYDLWRPRCHIPSHGRPGTAPRASAQRTAQGHTVWHRLVPSPKRLSTGRPDCWGSANHSADALWTGSGVAHSTSETGSWCPVAVREMLRRLC